MNAIPAHVAGVPEIVMVVPTPDGVRNPLVLAAAHLAGVSRAFTIGGAQAIAALAYGTATIPAVDKICGPGNAYVAAAKRRVFGAVGIDMVAGVSEILVIADATANPDWVAMDLFSQAEHDELAQAILVTPDAALLDASRRARSGRSSTCRAPRSSPRRSRTAARSIKVRDLDEACALANRIAPEHLELAVADPDALLPKIRHAGAIFMGHYASEALGDYCAGPNHVLPTGAHRALLVAARASTISRSARACSRLAPARRARSGPSRRRSRTAKGFRRTRAARCTALRRNERCARAADMRRAIVRPEDPGAHRVRVAGATGMIKLDAMENPSGWPERAAREARRRPRAACRSIVTPTAAATR